MSRAPGTAPVWRPLRISFILSSLWLSGGVMAVVEYANRLAARGHAVSLVLPKGTVDPLMSSMIAAAVSLVESKTGRAPTGNVARNLRLAWSLADAVPQSDVVVATHTPTTAANLLACGLLRRGAPVWLFMDYAEMFAQRPAEAWLLRHALRWQRMALTISRATAAELARYAPGRIEVVGVGISHLDALTPRFVEDRLTEPPILFYLGDMRPRKGLADFVCAAEKVCASRPSTRVVIASKDHCAIETSAHFTFIYKPSTEELAELYKTCAVFVCASWAEGLGNNPLEAMACATPVVMTETGGSSDYAEDGVNCLLVPPRNPATLEAAILRLLDDPCLAARLSHAGPGTAARFDWEVIMDCMEVCLLEAAG